MINAIENCFGVIREGWPVGTGPDQSAVQVVRCVSGRDQSTTYSTLGLSRCLLESPYTGRTLRMELVLHSRAGVELKWGGALLGQVASEMIESGRAVARGSCIGPRGAIFPGSIFEALYCTLPIFASEHCFQVKSDEGYDVAIVWLIPITAAEYEIWAAKGWEALEGHLDKIFDNVVGMERASLN